jgi:translocation and assembly module TamB
MTTSPTLPRIARALAWLAAVLLALALLAAGGAWWWAGTGGSLATALARAAAYLPEGQRLESRDVTGSLRAGGRIGWLRWSSPTLAVEVQDARIAWRLRPLLQRTLHLDALAAARVQLTPLGPPSTGPREPLAALELPLHVELPAVQVEQIVWAAPTPITLQHLQASYRYDGSAHHLALGRLDWAQGRYSARATLQGAAPMALNATLDGQLRTENPATGQPLGVAAQAQVQGTLATADARLQVQARIRPHEERLQAMRADLQATLAPWAAQPVVQAQADLQGVDLAALWPQAPVTQLAGQVRAGPEGDAWAVQAHLANGLPGPWDKARLPLAALDAQARYDGTQWQVPAATARLGDGSVALQGRYDTASGTLEGQATVRGLRPGDAHTALDRAPVNGTAQAQREADGAVRFAIDLRGTGGAPKTALAFDRVAAEGRWQGGTLQLRRVQVQALQARAESRQLQLQIAQPAFDGDLQLSVPGAAAQLQGRLAPRAGAGTLHLQLTQPQRTRDWLDALPGLGRLLPNATVQGQAQLDARWNGGWQALQRQLQTAGLLPGKPDTGAPKAFELQAQLAAPRLALAGPLDVQVQDLRATLAGSLAQASAAVDGQLRTGTQQLQLHARAQGGSKAAGQWSLQVTELKAQARDAQRPGTPSTPWALQLAQPLGLTIRQGGRDGLSVDASASQATLTGPAPGQATLRWQAAQWSQNPSGAMRLQTRGELHGLPLAWANAADPGLLERLGVGSSLVFDGTWDVNAADTLRATASLRRTSGDLHVLTGEPAGTTTLRSSGQGTGAGRPRIEMAPGTPAGVREARMELSLNGSELRAALRWDSERAGRLQAEGGSRITLPGNRWSEAGWPADAPIAATVKAQLPDLGVWSALAPPGWRVKGTLDANVQLSGTRTDPRWHGTLGADQMALRSVIDGVDLKDGRLRATLEGTRLTVTEFHLSGGEGNASRILGRGGNRTQAPKEGGELTGTGSVVWTPPAPGASAASGIAMDFQAEAKKLQVQVRADRQVSVSGQLQAQLAQGQFTLRGRLATDRATLILPDSSAPRLGADVVVRSAAKDREAAQEAAQSGVAQGSVQAARPPDVAITLDLGHDFALQGQGITTRLTGQLDIRSSAATGGLPRVTGEVRTEEGRYRAWGQALDVETGLVRFNGPYDNPALDILAIRPNISVRAGVQVTGSAQAPRVRLYADPDLPDAEKLSWVVLGHSAASGGSEAALLQQAALALLGGQGGGAGGIAKRLGVDEIGIKGPTQGEDASAAALTVGKRISSALYVTYEHSLSGTLGTLYLFYDLSRSLTLRGQTGVTNALDLVYTLRYD